MRLAITEILVWTLLWLCIGLIVAYYFGSHGWLIIPIAGASYGIVSGTVYSVLSHLTRTRQNRISLLGSSVIGLASSLCSVPVLVVMTVQFDAALIFSLIAGPITGVIVSLLSQPKQNNEATS